MTLCISLETPNGFIVDNVASTKELNLHCFILSFSFTAKWSMPKATDGKTESSSLSSLCMTLTTMAGTVFSFHFFFISFIIEAISEKRMTGRN